MTEQMTVYTSGDRFATMGQNGEARIWQVSENGVPDLADGVAIPQGEPKDLRSSQGGMRWFDTGRPVERRYGGTAPD